MNDDTPYIPYLVSSHPRKMEIGAAFDRTYENVVDYLQAHIDPYPEALSLIQAALMGGMTANTDDKGGIINETEIDILEHIRLAVFHILEREDNPSSIMFQRNETT